MVDASADALAVTMKIRRETRVAKEQALAEQASAPSGELALPPPIPGVVPRQSVETAAHMVVAPPEPAKPVDADTAFRRARLGFVSAIVLVLLLVWIVQRRVGASRVV